MTLWRLRSAGKVAVARIAGWHLPGVGPANDPYLFRRDPNKYLGTSSGVPANPSALLQPAFGSTGKLTNRSRTFPSQSKSNQQQASPLPASSAILHSTDEELQEPAQKVLTKTKKRKEDAIDIEEPLTKKIKTGREAEDKGGIEEHRNAQKSGSSQETKPGTRQAQIPRKTYPHCKIKFHPLCISDYKQYCEMCSCPLQDEIAMD
jgi:hypothetical protein